MNSEWFKDWFNTSEYLNVYRHRNESDAENHIKLILENVKINPGVKILDMACGAGRHSIILARKNFNVTAVDLSGNLLSVAKKTAEDENLSINFIQSDIRDFNTDLRFNLVLNLFTSFGYFESDEENFSVLQKAYDFLEKDGFFVLDYFNSEYLKNNLIPFSKDEIDNGKILQHRKIEHSRCIKKIILLKNDREDEYEESVRMYSKDELTTQLNKIGFDIYKTFGDFFGNEFNYLQSPRLIMICKK
jgi:cyclopropane fatty-acyl-phospholipid synthase-like methyltransferase